MSKTKQLVQKGSGGKPDIYVDPEAIRTVLNEFVKYVPGLATQIAEYAKDSNTAYIDGEFGRLTFLPETGALGGHYTDMRKNNIKYMTGLATNLVSIAILLDAAQQYYDASDGKTPTPVFVAISS